MPGTFPPAIERLLNRKSGNANQSGQGSQKHPHARFVEWLATELSPSVLVSIGEPDDPLFSALCQAGSDVESPRRRCYAVSIRTLNPPPAALCHPDLPPAAALGHIHVVVLAGEVEPISELFAPGSTGLLHLSATYSPSELQTLLTAWLPKLSDDGVVIMQGTLSWGGDSVRDVWTNLRQGRPGFEMLGDGGLGVVAPGLVAPPIISTLAALQADVAASLRRQLADGRPTERSRTTSAGGSVDRTAHELATLRNQAAGAARETERLREHIEAIRRSTSWRAMSPYRVAGRVLKSAIGSSIKPAWERQLRRDHLEIARSGAFDASFFRGRDTDPAERDEAIQEYLLASRTVIPRAQQHPGAPKRRPTLGFHPFIYAAECQGFDESTEEDPLAHYLRSGMPAGPWKHDVVLPGGTAQRGRGGHRILLHGHFYYPDLLPEFLERVRLNAAKPDLLITTSGSNRAAIISEILAAAGVEATLLDVPNKGRNIGPLLLHFGRLSGYDVVGHFHGKRSQQQSAIYGDNWRNFLWDHLLGGSHAMLDLIADTFAANPQLGVILPEDPNLNHWDFNASDAETLANRMGRPGTLPPHIEFPKGMMFYCRPGALRPLVELGWRWNDFPVEPLSGDGTVLHALERMVIFSAELAGFSFSTIHVPGSWRLS